MANFLWHYRAYELHLASEFELPELAPWPGDLDAAPDISVVLGAPLCAAALERALEVGEALQWGAREARLLFHLARFTVTQGARVVVEPVEGYGPPSWRLPLLGSVLAALLEQRGLFALHAGALVFESGAAAFLGDKGQGKSTLNAALSRAGFSLLSDDVVALQMPAPASSDAPLALPGFSQIKLVPDAVRAVTGDEVSLWPAVAPELTQMDKRSFQAPLAHQSAPLRALFMLHSAPNDETPAQASGAETIDGDGVRLRRLSAQEALAQLIPHTFGARFGPRYLTEGRRKTHFLNCARLVSSCAVWELSRPRDLALLPRTVELIARAMQTEEA